VKGIGRFSSRTVLLVLAAAVATAGCGAVGTASAATYAAGRVWRFARRNRAAPEPARVNS
jgi:hypothetical protein